MSTRVRETRPDGEAGVWTSPHTGETYDVILDHDGALWWTGVGPMWMAMPRWDAQHFEADDAPAWVYACTHDPVCDGPTECERVDG